MVGDIGPVKGRLVNLVATELDLPASVMLDTNVLAALLVPKRFEHGQLQRQRAEEILLHLVSEGKTGYAARQSAVEIAHMVAIQMFKLELARSREIHTSALKQRFPNQRTFGWPELMKVYDQPFVDAALRIREFCAALMMQNVRFLESLGFDEVIDASSYADALAKEMEGSRIDSADAAILLEARRAGISAIVTFDTDFRRVSRDFHVFTWF